MTQKLEILHTFLIQQIFILQPGTFLHSFFSHSIDIQFATRYIPSFIQFSHPIDIHFATRYIHSFILFLSNRYSFCNLVYSFIHPFLIQQIFHFVTWYIHLFIHPFLIQQIFILQPGTFIHSSFSHPLDIQFATTYIHSFILFSSIRYSVCNQVHTFINSFLIQQIFILLPGSFIH